MPEVNTYACDVCGAHKREVNRWWIVWTGADSRSGDADYYLHVTGFDEAVWGGLNATGYVRAVACGEEHVHELFSRWLVSRTFLAPSQRPLQGSGVRTEGSGETLSPRPSPLAPASSPPRVAPTQDDDQGDTP